MTNPTDTLSSPIVTLHDGTQMPQLGYGLWQVDPVQTAQLVQHALVAGYRSIDTARIYDNEEGVGEALRRTDVAREEIFVTTKLWNTRHAYDEALGALDRSLERLGLEQVDLYLIHWPSPMRGQFVEAWRALVQAQADGKARAIGVSNFGIDHLERIVEATGVVPVLNQVELHPYMQQRELRAWHEAHGVRTEAWSPLGQGGELLADPVIAQVAERAGCTPAQAIIRWHLDVGNVVIPKSATPSRIVENFEALAVELSDDDRRAIDGLDRGAAGRIGPDPSTAAF